MKLEKTVTTEILSFEKDGWAARLRVGLLNGEFLELCHGSLSKNNRVRGMLKYEEGMLLVIDDELEVDEFLEILSEKFRERYSLELPELIEDVIIPPTDIESHE